MFGSSGPGSPQNAKNYDRMTDNLTVGSCCGPKKLQAGQGPAAHYAGVTEILLFWSLLMFRMCRVLARTRDTVLSLAVIVSVERARVDCFAAFPTDRQTDFNFSGLILPLTPHTLKFFGTLFSFWIQWARALHFAWNPWCGGGGGRWVAVYASRSS